MGEITPAGLDRFLIVNSGAEAVDNALKLARLATGRAGVICCAGGWHGFTLGALSVSEREMCRSFGPLLAGVQRVPFGDALALREAISREVGAVLVEAIQCESGAVVPAPGYLREAVEICKSAGIMLIIDEIKSGVGKTGGLFACQWENVQPDVLLMGKSLGALSCPLQSWRRKQNGGQSSG